MEIFTPEEDKALVNFVVKHGYSNWEALSSDTILKIRSLSPEMCMARLDLLMNIRPEDLEYFFPLVTPTLPEASSPSASPQPPSHEEEQEDQPAKPKQDDDDFSLEDVPSSESEDEDDASDFEEDELLRTLAETRDDLEFDDELAYHRYAYYPDIFKRPKIPTRPRRIVAESYISPYVDTYDDFNDRSRGTRASQRLRSGSFVKYNYDDYDFVDAELDRMEKESKPNDDEGKEKIDRVLAVREISRQDLDKDGNVSHSKLDQHLHLLHSNKDEIVTQFLIKPENTSYMRAEWIDYDDIEERFGLTGAAKVDRFYARKDEIEEENEKNFGGEPFDPAYLEIERIIGRSVFDGAEKFLVKWKELAYSEATWESPELLDNQSAIDDYWRNNRIPKAMPLEEKALPAPAKAAEWYSESPVFKGGNKLRDYQLDGVNWLIKNFHVKQSSILADEMGLGKTVQAVAYLNYLFSEENMKGPFLVVVPLSTIEHWMREAREWTEMNTVLYYEPVNGKVNRAIIREYDFYYPGTTKTKFHTIVTTYETLLADIDELETIHWEQIVIDEGHKLKNKNSKIVKTLSRLNVSRRLLLTGTPIQNNTHELWTLLNYIEPENFFSAEEFSEKFGDLKHGEQVEALQIEIRPYVLRRMKETVEKSIPPKEETIIDIELTTLQKQYYRAIYERNREYLYDGCTKSNLPSLINIEMELRKCCNHPWLIKGVEDKEIPASTNEKFYIDKTVDASGKMVLLDKLLPKLKSEGHRVLIFSQMKRVLDILEEYVGYRGYGYERLDGNSKGNARQASIDRFSRPDSDKFVFLLSTRAGGVGLNLTAADTVIIYDSDWNPQQDLQAQARVHRIGQKRNVMIYRLVTRNTYESEMFERASMKLGLDQAVLHNMTRDGMLEEDKLQLDRLLKLGFYGLMDDDSAAQKFQDSNIDDILAHGSRKVTHKAQSEQSGGLGAVNYSKMTFASAGSDASIDINDPDFWAKVLKKKADDVINVHELTSKLVDGSAVQTKGSRTEFFELLKKKMKQTLTAKQNGQTIKDLHDVTSLLNAFISSPKFSASEKNIAKAWMKDLKRRGGSKRSLLEYESDEDVEDSGGEEVDDDDDDADEVDDFENVKALVDAGISNEVFANKQNWKDALCVECHQRGKLIYCDGPCGNLFHPVCAGLAEDQSVPPTEDPWLCPHCATSTYDCGVCGNEGYSDDKDYPVMQCTVPRCGWFYHFKCVKTFKNSVLFKSEKFRCPKHTCLICEEGKSKKGGGNMLVCEFCPNAYHISCFPSSERYIKLSNRVLVCPSCLVDKVEDESVKNAINHAVEKVDADIVRKRGTPLPAIPSEYRQRVDASEDMVAGKRKVRFSHGGECVLEDIEIEIEEKKSKKKKKKTVEDAEPIGEALKAPVE